MSMQTRCILWAIAITLPIGFKLLQIIDWSWWIILLPVMLLVVVIVGAVGLLFFMAWGMSKGRPTDPTVNTKVMDIEE